MEKSNNIACLSLLKIRDASKLAHLSLRVNGDEPKGGASPILSHGPKSSIQCIFLSPILLLSSREPFSSSLLCYFSLLTAFLSL
jgi:hypothetical protein